MNDLTTTPTAELLAEWERLDDIRPIDRGVASIYHEQCDSIAAKLDRRCEDAGISLIVGLPCFTKFEDYEIPETERDYRPRLESATLSITIHELRDLLSWLLTKGGNG